MRTSIFIAIISIMMSWCITSCDEPERTMLTREENELLDSLYAKQVSGVRKYADSICAARYQTIFDEARDSFYMSYVREIEQILNGEQ